MGKRGWKSCREAIYVGTFKAVEDVDAVQSDPMVCAHTSTVCLVHARTILQAFLEAECGMCM